MDLKGAEIRTFYHVTEDLPTPAVPAEWPKDVRIPLYQRPYRWGEPQISKLINDYLAEPGKSYFSGSIVTVNNTDKDVHELIDGQQRYTTIYLVNYVAFLIARVLIREAIQTRKVKALDSLVASFRRSALYLFRQDAKSLGESESQQNSDNESNETQNSEIRNGIDLQTAAFSRSVDNVFESDDPTDEDIEKLLDELNQISALPITSIQGDPSYIDDCTTSFENYLSNKTLRLEYDRPIFNTRLKTSLTYLTVTLSSQENLALAVNDAALAADETLNVYVDAVRTIFDEFSKVDKSSTPFITAKNILEKISDFLNGIMLCVVQTGHPKDAFTLFEVLNDRSLALSDLDLIKNQFYRTYVLANASESDSKLDITLQKIDDLWVQGIFDGEGAAKSDLISYLAIVYLSGSTTAIHKKQESIRDALDTYFKQKNGSYSETELERDIYIFSYCKIFIRLAGLKFKGSEGEALCDVYDSNKPLLYQVASYLIASNQESVLAGLVCFLIKEIVHNSTNTMSPAVFETQLNAIATNSSSKVHEQAKYIWQSSILSKDASVPRGKASSLIERNNMDTSSADPYLQPASTEEFQTFEAWINNWSYNDTGSGKFKIRYLFAKLIGLNAINGQPAHTVFKVSINRDDVKKLHLDHMEAKSPDLTHIKDYFQHADRDRYVHGLGNMMPLPGSQNISKGNQPFHPSVFDAIKASGFPASHFLYVLSEDHFKNHNLSNVPTEDFFVNRKAEIVDLFKKAIAL